MEAGPISGPADMWYRFSVWSNDNCGDNGANWRFVLLFAKEQHLSTSTASAAQHGRRASASGRTDEGRADELLQRVLSSLDDDKALDVVTINLRGRSTLADAMVVATGRSHRHVGAMADHLLRRLKEAGYGKVRVEGLPHCDWVLIDAADVVVHLFRPEVRDFYNLEKIWAAEVPNERRVM